MFNGEVKYINDWSENDPTIIEIRDDAMLPVSKGVYYHSRLRLLIVVSNELDSNVARYLPN